MVADDMACNPRNPRPATVFNNEVDITIFCDIFSVRKIKKAKPPIHEFKVLQKGQRAF